MRWDPGGRESDASETEGGGGREQRMLKREFRGTQRSG